MNYTKRGVVVQLGTSPNYTKQSILCNSRSLLLLPPRAPPPPLPAVVGLSAWSWISAALLRSGRSVPAVGGVLPCRHPLRGYSPHKGCRQVNPPSYKIVNFCLLLEV